MLSFFVREEDAENFTSLAKSPNEDESAINARVVAWESYKSDYFFIWVL